MNTLEKAKREEDFKQRVGIVTVELNKLMVDNQVQLTAGLEYKREGIFPVPSFIDMKVSKDIAEDQEDVTSLS